MQINWIIPIALSYFFVEIITLKLLYQLRPELYLYRLNHAHLSQLTPYIFEKKQTKQIRRENTL